MERSRMTAADFTIGDRVQTHPATDAWIQGDRFGDVVRIGADDKGNARVTVRMDKSGRLIRFAPTDLFIVA